MTLQNQIDYYKAFHDEDFFSGCSVPPGLDMLRVRGAIVMRCGLLTPLYSEPETQKAATEQFFGENHWNFQHIVNILEAEYSPIENVFEDTMEHAIGEGETSLEIRKGATETTTREVSAENVAMYQADRKDTTTGSGADVHITKETGDRGTSKTRHGNIGITSSVQLIREEIGLTSEWNAYKQIADMYENTLMLGVY